MEGAGLERAGVQIGARFVVDKRLDDRLNEDFRGKSFNVTSRTRNGLTRPLMEIRCLALGEVFDQISMVKLAIRAGRIVITANYIEANAVKRVRRVWEKLQNDMALTVGSVFHAGGVMDKAMHEGFSESGVQTFVQVAVELERKYLASSLRNNPELFRDDSVLVTSDIRLVEWPRLPYCDILMGGVPCTGASRSGISKNKLEVAEEHESAGSLFYDYLEAVKYFNPAVTVLENVPEYGKTASMMVVRSVLGSRGYRLYEAVLDGNTFGALEARHRLVLIGITDKFGADFDAATVLPVRIKEGSLKEILDDVPLDSSRWKANEGLAAKAIRDKEAGKGFSRQLLTGDEGRCGTIGKGYNKNRSTEPFIVHPQNPELSRLLTVGEHARVKGIPESIVDGESTTVAHEILGQSVIYPVFKAVGLALGQYLLSTMPNAVRRITVDPVATIPSEQAA
jgi:DNA (cytosine-5)-methyltransferase 1